MRNGLSHDVIERAEARFIEEAKAGRDESAWELLQPLLHAQSHQEEAALALVRLVEHGYLSRERSLDVLQEVYAAHQENERVVGLLGEALEQARDVDMLNAPPPESPLFAAVADRLASFARQARDAKHEKVLLSGLATAARMMARQRDELAESSYLRLLELEPDRGHRHYNYGLFLKTRGRFHEGMLANQRAVRLAKEPVESYEWNLGICATGAKESAVALEVWKRMEQNIEMGRFGLPEGRYPQCKVRLAERPLAERTADEDDPGLEETIWIERLSPCHGIIRSVLYHDLGVDYGDVIVIDGAPITYHKYGDREVPVFPHLATLVRNNYQFFDFTGTQEEGGQIESASQDLERDAIVYSHSENFRVVCAACWRNPSANHKHDEEEQKHVVRGRIAAPPDLDASDLIRQLDAAMAKRGPARIYVPDLCEAAGHTDRAAIERRRFDMLIENS